MNIEYFGENNVTFIINLLKQEFDEYVKSVSGMGLSHNDFTDAYIEKISNLEIDKVDKVEGKQLSTNDFDNSYKDKVDGVEAGAQENVIEGIKLNGVLQEVTNKIVELSVMTNVVDDLINYYKKSETYTKAEVNSLVSEIPKFSIRVVNSLPSEDISTTTIYLLKTSQTEIGNLYSEYIYVEYEQGLYKWEMLGTQTLDLSNYVQKDEGITVNQFIALWDYIFNETAIPSSQVIDEGQFLDKTSLQSFLTYLKNNMYVKTEVDNLISNLEATITFSIRSLETRVDTLEGALELQVTSIQEGTNNGTIRANYLYDDNSHIDNIPVKGLTYNSQGYLTKKGMYNDAFDGTAYFKENSGDKSIYTISEELFEEMHGYPRIKFDTLSEAKEINGKIVFEVYNSSQQTYEYYDFLRDFGEQQVRASILSLYCMYTVKRLGYTATDDVYLLGQPIPLTTRYATLADIEDLKIGGSNLSLAGMTTFSNNLDNFGSVGISGGVDEWTNLTADPVPTV